MSEQPDKRELICELGRLLGQKHAFSLVAGACLAADAVSLRGVRENKAYRELNLTWDQFCREHVGLTRPAVDKILRQLDEFGPEFFKLSAILHITAEEYRRIAPSIDADGVTYEGKKIPLSAGNVARLKTAVDALLSRRTLPEPQPTSGAPAENAEQTLAKAERALDLTVADLARLNALDLDAGIRSRIQTVAMAARERLDEILLSAA
jgi:hypothetical protein